jgi:hypothetical protein
MNRIHLTMFVSRYVDWCTLYAFTSSDNLSLTSTLFPPGLETSTSVSPVSASIIRQKVHLERISYSELPLLWSTILAPLVTADKYILSLQQRTKTLTRYLINLRHYHRIQPPQNTISPVITMTILHAHKNARTWEYFDIANKYA